MNNDDLRAIIYEGELEVYGNNTIPIYTVCLLKDWKKHYDEYRASLKDKTKETSKDYKSSPGELIKDGLEYTRKKMKKLFLYIIN